jgi:hypothetical protein
LLCAWREVLILRQQEQLPHGLVKPPLVLLVSHIPQERWYVHPLSHSP